jgi:hypothetical protein
MDYNLTRRLVYYKVVSKHVMDKCVQQLQFFEDSKNVLKSLEKIKQIHQQLQVKMLGTKIVFFFLEKNVHTKILKLLEKIKQIHQQLQVKMLGTKIVIFFLEKKIYIQKF